MPWGANPNPRPFGGYQDEVQDEVQRRADERGGSFGLKKWLGKPMRDGGEYEGVDRNEFNVPGYQGRDQRLRDWQTSLMARQAPTAGETGQWRGQQGALADMLMQQAQGKNSLAAEQFRQASDRGVAQQQALAASARPGQGATAARMAAQNSAGLMQGLAGQAAQAGLAERMAAGQALGGVLGQARGQDQNLQTFNAQQRLAQQGLNQEGLLGLMGQELQQAGMQQAGGMGYESNRLGRYNAALGVPTNGEGALNAFATMLPFLYPR